MNLLFQGCQRWETKYSVLKVLETEIILVNYRGTLKEIRLWGILCPEYFRACNDSAKLFLQKLLKNQKIRLIEYGKDSRGRIMAEVILEPYQNINHLLLKKGYAKHFKLHNEDPLYTQYEREAKSKKLGLWKERVREENEIKPQSKNLKTNKNSF
ncbi:MAG: thermonuclease family protein [Bacteroidia bacterium]|nr:thermonuclease family protein [Bacteroidia bacterium]MDW8159293.1 thermonuclease family protein [Bacteroidia bacterium]